MTPVGEKRARVEAFIYGPPSGGLELGTLPIEIFEHLFGYLSVQDKINILCTSKVMNAKIRDVFTRSVKWLCSHVSQACITAEWKLQMRSIRLDNCEDVSCIPYYIQELELVDSDWEIAEDIRRNIRFPSHLTHLRKLVVEDENTDPDDGLDVDLSELPGLKYAEISITGCLLLPSSRTLETLKLRQLGSFGVDLSFQTGLKHLDTERALFANELDLRGLAALEKVTLRGVEPVKKIFLPKHWAKMEKSYDPVSKLTVLKAGK